MDSLTLVAKAGRSPRRFNLPHPLGTDTSQAEVTNIDTHGIWVLVRDKEYFLPHEDFPWFKRAEVEDIVNVELLHGVHLYWPVLDVDLALDSLENPEKFPLVADA